MNTELPELPNSYGDHCVTDSVRTMREPGYTAEQMREYARAALRAAASGVGEAFLYVREIDAGTDNACWVVGNAVDPGAIPVFDSPPGAEARDAEVTDAMVERALHATVPGGGQVWCWLPSVDAWTPHETARSVMRAALVAVVGREASK